MPVTQIPSRDPLTPTGDSPEQRDLFEAQHWETAYRGFNPDDVPHLLIQLQDDLSRQRKQEALWLSVILHLLVIILLWNTDKLMMLFGQRAVVVPIRAMDNSKDATFLELPPDAQKVTRRPDAKVLSDKDRIATSKAPQINREDLKKLLAASPHPGRPGANMQAPPAGGQPAQMAQNQAPPAPQDNPQQGFAQPQPSEQTPRLQTPPQTRPTPNFNASVTAGSAIEQAVRAAATNHGAGGGQAGDYGLSRGQNGAKTNDMVEILTDTMGFDFWAYIKRIHPVVERNWYDIMPPSVFPPISKQGKVQIEFVILKDGTIAGLVIHAPSGDVALDRAAMGSITASTPFPPLPKGFPGQTLGLRFSYYYNVEPGGSDMK